MLYEIDDLAPPPRQFVRTCSAKDCPRIACPGAWYCKQHNAAAAQAWRARNRTSHKAKRREVAANRTEEARAADNARAKLAVYIARGKISRQPCIEPRCASDDVTAYIADPAQWRTPTWVCRDHRHATVEDMERRERELQNRDAYAVRRDVALAIFDALPADMQAAIRERAARGPMGLTLSPESPLFLQRLVAEIERLI